MESLLFLVKGLNRLFGALALAQDVCNSDSDNSKSDCYITLCVARGRLRLRVKRVFAQVLRYKICVG